MEELHGQLQKREMGGAMMVGKVESGAPAVMRKFPVAGFYVNCAACNDKLATSGVHELAQG
jgi:hypothetical protein